MWILYNFLWCFFDGSCYFNEIIPEVFSWKKTFYENVCAYFYLNEIHFLFYKKFSNEKFCIFRYKQKFSYNFIAFLLHKRLLYAVISFLHQPDIIKVVQTVLGAFL